MRSFSSNLHCFFIDNEITQGKQYFSNGRVLQTEITGGYDDLEIKSSVVGKARRHYKQDIFLSRMSDHNFWEDVDIDGYCSCPAGYNCKHVVAVLFAVEKQVTTDLSSHGPGFEEVTQIGGFGYWVNQAIATADTKKPKAEPTTSAYLLVYELHNTRDQPSVKPVKTRRLKSGELSKAASTQVRIHNIQGNENYLEPLDIEILSPLRMCRENETNTIGFLYDSIRPEGYPGMLALKLLLRSKRFYLGDYRNGKLLNNDTEREGSLQWIVNPGGDQ